ncbi:MAG: ABC transporter substrate-binding protein [Terriglobia bacterium]|nr:ABC transporter substrate-binding protein [Terriglobia bacterium]
MCEGWEKTVVVSEGNLPIRFTQGQDDKAFCVICRLLAVFVLGLIFLLTSCSSKPPVNTAVMIIESSPTNLDPRVGTDAQSERIDKLMFDSLVRRDEHLNLQPWVAERWEIPDPLTYIFHLRHDVGFSDGRPLTSADVKWTLDSIMRGKIRTAKAATYQFIDHVEAPDPYTLIIKLKQPYATLLWNLSDGAFGIVPNGAGADFSRHPIGSGPFRLVSMAQDKDVIVERNPNYWGTPAKIPRVRFVVVPDPTTRALELRKGSADAEINALTPDTVVTLEHDPDLVTERAPGTIYAYLTMNLRDPILKHLLVRQAIAYALNREPLIKYLWRDQVRPADSILPPQSWAYNGDVEHYPHDPARARQLLDEAGYKPGPDGIRFHLTMKTSTEESTRLFAAVLQQQLRNVGIALDIRSYEFATFYADVVKGSFQLYSMRWIGGNQDPDIFENVFDSASFAPKRANRSYYSNPEVDKLIADGRGTVDEEARRKDYFEIQRILAHDLPYINLWYFDNILVHSKRLKNVKLGLPGDYDFLATAELDDGH